jgi:hypothetical protein
MSPARRRSRGLRRNQLSPDRRSAISVVPVLTGGLSGMDVCRMRADAAKLSASARNGTIRDAANATPPMAWPSMSLAVTSTLERWALASTSVWLATIVGRLADAANW